MYSKATQSQTEPSQNGPTNPATSTNGDGAQPADNASQNHKPISNWASKTGKTPPSAYDLRSDVITTPTASMLNAISDCTLLDDVFMEDPTTTALESFVAELTGKEAGLLVLSGTMGNQVALRTHLGGPPHSILCDYRSHIVCWEAGGAASMSGALMLTVQPGNGHHITIDDVRKYAVVDDDVHSCPTRVISLENTLNGTVMPLADAQAISEFAKEHGILMHLDGARIWEAVVAGHGSLKDYCACFDTISLCFSKGLGAPIGSILVGTKAFVKRARHIRKMIGGGLRQAGVISAAARVAVEETFLGGLLTQSHTNARRIAKEWTSRGGECSFPVETNMVWLDLKAAGVVDDEFIKVAQTKGLRIMGGRLVIHYQVGEETISKLAEVFEELLKKKGQGSLDVANGAASVPPEDMKVSLE